MKRAVLNKVTLFADGSIFVEWLKQVTDPDTDEVLVELPHPAHIPFDGDVEASTNGNLANLAAIGYPADAAVSKALVDKIDAIGRADPTIEASRAAKIQAAREKAAQEAAAQEAAATAVREAQAVAAKGAEPPAPAEESKG